MAPSGINEASQDWSELHVVSYPGQRAPDARIPWQTVAAVDLILQLCSALHFLSRSLKERDHNASASLVNSTCHHALRLHLFGLDALGEELEAPFGLMPNNLPILAYAAVIDIHLHSAMGETDLPPMPFPQDYVLT